MELNPAAAGPRRTSALLRGTRPTVAVFVFVLAIGVVGRPFRGAPVNAASQNPPTKLGQFPDGPGKDTFVSVCSLCHAPNAPAGKQWTRTEWELKVIEMLQEEPFVTADERKQIVDYLTATFKPGGRIYINLAGAADLARLLDVPLQESERIFRHRLQNGPFASVDAVKAVAGITAAKIDAKAKDLEF